MTLQEYTKWEQNVISAFKEYCEGKDVDFDTKEMLMIADYFDVNLPKCFYDNFIVTYNKYSYRAYGCFKTIDNCIKKLIKKGEQKWGIQKTVI